MTGYSRSKAGGFENELKTKMARKLKTARWSYAEDRQPPFTNNHPLRRAVEPHEAGAEGEKVSRGPTAERAIW
jgi:hypothetical protein